MEEPSRSKMTLWGWGEGGGASTIIETPKAYIRMGVRGPLKTFNKNVYVPVSALGRKSRRVTDIYPLSVPGKSSRGHPLLAPALNPFGISRTSTYSGVLLLRF